jgi:hypothetical protein
MTTFLLKLHSTDDIGGAEPRPSEASQWERARIKFKPPSKITGGRGADVVDGDTLIIWTHEAPSFGRGLGLTAEGVASDVRKSDDGTWSATISQVRLLKPHFRLRGWNQGTTGSAVIDYLLRYILSRTYELDDAELSEFRAVIEKSMARASVIVPKSDDRRGAHCRQGRRWSRLRTKVCLAGDKAGTGRFPRSAIYSLRRQMCDH